MEVDGKEFMRNVGIEQDKDRLIQEQKRLEALKREAYLRDEQERKTSTQGDDPYLDLSLNPSSNSTNFGEPPVTDLKLEQEDPNKTKKKYLLLGIALILVFVITILVIRLISNSDTEKKMENLNPPQEKLSADKILDKIDTNEEYQKAIEKNLAQKEVDRVESQRSSVPDLVTTNEKIENTPLVIEKPKVETKPEKDLFGLDTQKVQQEVKKVIEQPVKRVQEQVQRIQKPKEEVKKVEPRKISSVLPPQEVKVAKAINNTPVNTKTTQNVSGYYIQVGAFTKQPSNKLLQDITNKGFTYVIYPVNIKGKVYNKVLIGAYPTRKTALNDLNSVKQKLKKSGAYILKF